MAQRRAAFCVSAPRLNGSNEWNVSSGVVPTRSAFDNLAAPLSYIYPSLKPIRGEADIAVEASPSFFTNPPMILNRVTAFSVVEALVGEVYRVARSREALQPSRATVGSAHHSYRTVSFGRDRRSARWFVLLFEWGDSLVQSRP